MAATEQLMDGTTTTTTIGGGGASSSKHLQSQSDSLPAMMSSFFSFHLQSPESARIFDELPKATIIQVSRPDAADISPVMLTYTIEFQYKEFKWQLVKKASQVFILHFALKKRAFFEEIHEKQEQAREWLQNLGIGDHTAVVQEDDEPDDETTPLRSEPPRNDESVRNR